MMARPPGAAHEVDLALADVTLVGDIAADGRTIAFAEFGDVDTANGIYTRPTNGGPATPLGSGLAFDLDARGVLGLTEHGELAVFEPARGPRAIALPGLERPVAARWCAGGFVVAASVPGRPARLWYVASAPAPLTGEGVAGSFAIHPDGRAVAVIDGDRLLAIELPGGPPRVVATGVFDHAICGWGEALFVRRRGELPVRVSRVDPATGAHAPAFAIAPPPLGLRGVDVVAVDDAGDGYAYSFGQELSRLYAMLV
jgi:hypothetical protein